MRLIPIILLLFSISESLFAQTIEILSSDLNRFQNVRDFCISSDETEAYFSIQSPNQDLSQIVCVKNKKWKTTYILPFCDGYSYLEPFLSNDGKRLYFASDRPKTDSEITKSDFDIWYVERKSNNSEWSRPINMGSNVNSEHDEFYPSIADNNNLYFTMVSESGLGKDDIWFCKWNGMEYSKPILLSENINSEGYEFNAFISRDENFLIFTKYDAQDGFGSGDLCVSRKDENGEWKVAENMGEIINTRYMEYCPFYDSVTSILYFTSKRNNLSPQKFKNTEQYQEYISGSENGLSRIYKYKIKL